MNKKLFIRKIVLFSIFLLITAQNIFGMNNSDLVFNQPLLGYFLKYFNQDIVNEKPFEFFLGIKEACKNEAVYVKEKIFLDYFLLGAGPHKEYLKI